MTDVADQNTDETAPVPSEPQAPVEESVAVAAPVEEEIPSPPPSAPSPVEETPVVQKHFIAPALLPLDRVDEDFTFLVRHAAELEDVASLATDIARLGQLFPIDVRLVAPDRFQIITGFRRISALKFLQREKVLARLHTDLSDADATLMTLADAIHGASVSPDALTAFRDALESSGKLSPSARDMLLKALTTEDGLAPENVEEEVDADELAADVTTRLGQINQDLSLLADVFAELDDGRREELLRQLKYSADLVAFLESKQ
jgi:ParB family chromosome partitioning protein